MLKYFVFMQTVGYHIHLTAIKNHQITFGKTPRFYTICYTFFIRFLAYGTGNRGKRGHF